MNIIVAVVLIVGALFAACFVWACCVLGSRAAAEEEYLRRMRQCRPEDAESVWEEVTR